MNHVHRRQPWGINITVVGLLVRITIDVVHSAQQYDFAIDFVNNTVHFFEVMRVGNDLVACDYILSC